MNGRDDVCFGVKLFLMANNQEISCQGVEHWNNLKQLFFYIVLRAFEL